jgi:energy-converting hydrogenase Eha subunit E
LENGNRVSLLTSINLSQISEFSLVIAAIGFAAGHIGQDVLSIIIFIFVITSISSTYMIQYSDPIQKALNHLLQKIGVKDIATSYDEPVSEREKDIAILGFFRVASSLIHELQEQQSDGNDEAPPEDITDKIVVIDFNPNVYTKLRAHGVKAVYGDVSHLDTLHHAGIHAAKVAMSTIPDTILKGTTNLQLIRYIQHICPHAKIIVTAESTEQALEMYAEGADYVFLPRILAAQHLIPIIELLLSDDPAELEAIKQAHIDKLSAREEIVS